MSISLEPGTDSWLFPLFAADERSREEDQTSVC
jgi:hypothetical protein